jgi:hypothetical protein
MAMSGHCFRHLERAGVGICVDCRRVICTECTTQFEGINRCSGCLEARLQQTRTLAERREWTVMNVLLAVLGIGVLWGLVAFASSLGRA